ncbi:MAG TPA: ATP phosphoribosyltransferase regulatory subunit [Dehalococcoidia bacterium]|nr:ATP phosphoribosyltransferase regulatory subunit [Dehalococcoidia bacterium]
MRVQKCKGTRDLSPDEMARFRIIEEVFRERCLRWGYQEVRTPTIEYLHLFTSAGTLTPSMLGKVYSFLDWDGWSGERVVLRPDGTIPVARLYIDAMAGKGLARLFYVTNTFIFEETGKKTRERWQCGTELIGVNTPASDAELIVLALEILNKLKLKNVTLRLSHAGLIKALLERLDLSPEEQERVFDRILDGDARALAGMRIDKAELDSILLPLLNLKGHSSGFLKNLRAISARSLPEFEPYLNNFIDVVSILENLGIKYQIDIASGAGFEYYTGIIFQLYSGREKIGGGGRYDNLIPAMGGGDVPASGFALYIDRLMNLVEPEIWKKPVPPSVLVRSEADAEMKEAFDAASLLRDAGYTVAFDLGSGEPTDTRWLLEIRGKKPKYVLRDKFEPRAIEAETINEVMAVIEEKSGHQDSPAERAPS